jgi:beta-glucanase (GH16 family)
LRNFYRLIAVTILALCVFALGTPSMAYTTSSSVAMPSRVTASASNQAVTIKWTKPSTSTKKISGYRVTASYGSWRAIKTTSSSATTVKFTGLTNGRTYKFATQAMSGQYVSKTVTVSSAPRKPLLANSIEFSQPADMFLDAEDQLLIALTRGADAVFTSLSPETCMVIDGRVHPVAIGDCTIRAMSPANSSYLAAMPVVRLLTIANAPNPLNKTLLWSDEFDGAAGAAPNSSNWTSDISDGCQAPYNNCGWGNNERQYYVTNANTTDGSANGILNIVAKRQTNATNYRCYYGRCEWVSGKMTTYGKVGFTYGYTEARIKVAPGEGSWPAFWGLGTNISSVGWPASGELDIMEYKGSQPQISHGTVHFANSGGGHQQLGGVKDALVDLSADYHRFGMLWLPNEVTFYLDDNVVYTARKSDSGLTYWPFGRNAAGADPTFYLILNLAMGGNFGGSVSESLNTTTLAVDWVRYYSVDGVGKVTR